MFVLTRDIGTPLVFEAQQHAIGVLADLQAKQSYFYCWYNEAQSRCVIIFRCKISGESTRNWEFVGKLDFRCDYMTISSCKKYFWSLERDYHTSRNRLIFRQITPKTLKYEVFQMPDLSSLESVQSAHFHYTQNWGIFLIVQCKRDQVVNHIEYSDYLEETDVIFCFDINQDQKQINLTQIQLPDIPTVQPYPMPDRMYYWWFKKARYGLIDHSYSLCFYQIDYFGDIFVLEWNEFKDNESLEWVKFKVGGDNFKPWVALRDRDFLTHPHKATTQQWIQGVNQLNCNERFYLQNNVLCCTNFYGETEPGTHFYHCEFLMEQHICKCRRIFSTHHVFNFYRQNAIMTSPFENESLNFFLIKDFVGCGDAPGWEQIMLHKIPTLLILAYSQTRQVVEKKNVAMNSSTLMAVNNNEMALSFPIVNQVSGKGEKTWMEEIIQKFKQIFLKKELNVPPSPSTFTLQKHQGIGFLAHEIYEDKSNVCRDERTKVLPMLIYSSVKDLLDKLKK